MKQLSLAILELLKYGGKKNIFKAFQISEAKNT